MTNQRNKIHTLRFRAVNRDIFDAIKNGSKPVETRAATKKYHGISAGDEIRFVCGRQTFTRKARKARIFKTIPALLKTYKVRDINPSCKDAAELTKVYYSFPSYREKIKSHGLIAIELQG